MSTPLTHGHALALAACCLAVGLLGGCGEEDLPDGVAAEVGDHAITQAAVKRAAVGTVAIRHSAETMPPYLPGDVEGCVAAKRSQAADATPTDLRQRCEQIRDRQEAAALGLLIRGQWYRLEAEKQGVAIPAESKGARWSADHAGVKIKYLLGVSEAYLLQFKLISRLVKGRTGGASERVIADYNARLGSDYRDDTVCADDHDVPECE